MKSYRPAVLAAALSLAGVAAEAAVIGPRLTGELTTASASDLLEVIVTWHGQGAPTSAQLDQLDGLGLSGVSMHSLPMAGVLATPAQVNAMASLGDVRSIYLNAPLAWDNEQATELTGVDRLRADNDIRPRGLPVTGRGIGVVVNDSGVDGTHPDLEYGSHVVQNVLGATNLLHSDGFVAPHTWVEGVPNTDIAGGHGSHVAGIIGATGAMSDNGRMEGVAPGADIVGYGSGAALFILDTIGGFDYALTNQFEHNIRVISNSFGNPSETGTDFDPEDPTNIATKALADNGIVVVFSAGNSGSGEGTITGNFKKAPWVITVAAGNKQGQLAGFSSRGRRDTGGEYFDPATGETLIWEDRPTVTAPGEDIYSVRATTGDGLDLLGADQAAEDLSPAELPFYMLASGTSMSAPHVSGIVALMLEANPSLGWQDVKRILQETATNIPGLEPWEAGAGYVNAYAAVEAVLDRASFGDTPNALRAFNANANVSLAASDDYPIGFTPAGESEVISFEVGGDISFVEASANVGTNTVALVLNDPAGNRYGSSISLPVIGQNIAASAPGMAGTWTLQVRGIGSVSGIALDPLGLTNGYAVPTALTEDIMTTVRQIRVDDITGLNDLGNSPAAAFIETAVTRRLIDSDADGNYRPNDLLTRGELAQFLVMGAGLRQAPANQRGRFPDVDSSFIDAAMATGAALKDGNQDDLPIILASFRGPFAPDTNVTREELAYALVQALGLQQAASTFAGDNTVQTDNGEIMLTDTGDITAYLRGWVQLAVANELLPAAVRNGPLGTEAYFYPQLPVTRAAFAAAAIRFLNAYNQ